MEYDFNYLAILLAAVASMVVGGIWYSPLMFAKPWMELNGFKDEDLPSPSPTMAKAFVSQIILAFGMAITFKLLNLAGAFDGAIYGAAIAILYVGGATFPNYAFEDRSIALFFIHMGNTVVAMTAMGFVLSAMS